MYRYTFESPSLVKVLSYLKDKLGQEFSPEEIVREVGESKEYVEPVLNRLMAIGIISRSGNLYSYRGDKQAEEISARIFLVYKKVAETLSIQLIIRGLIDQRTLPVNLLVEMLVKKGFANETINNFIAQEVGKGYIRGFNVLFVGGLPSRFFHFRHFSSLRFVSDKEYQKIKNYCKDSGIDCFEQEYLAGKYPPELILPAREFVKNQYYDLEVQLLEEAISLPSR